eukprot:scaffold257_cov241-Pinguiococcus_pyrenoidosus.AAC.2
MPLISLRLIRVHQRVAVLAARALHRVGAIVKLLLASTCITEGNERMNNDDGPPAPQTGVAPPSNVVL